jgi:hypothetical protein
MVFGMVDDAYDAQVAVRDSELLQCMDKTCQRMIGTVKYPRETSRQQRDVVQHCDKWQAARWATRRTGS